ncbi:MAG TPA: nitroreductase/quinone reductase family protein [Candidatus Acidoferrales bacterium]|nr:nitroreductase/quinone reductase family protein [Candidatus Acidoferrales bacterium]
MPGKPNQTYRRPALVERLFSRVFGLLVRLGLGLPHNYLLQVRGRKTGRTYSTPVDVLKFRGNRYLVAPRGQTQWVRNAQAAGEIRLIKAWSHRRYRLRSIPDAQKPQILKAYLDRFALTVQRYFPVRAGSPVEAFAPLTADYPAFELLPPDQQA